MVRVLNLVVMLLASALTAEACSYCQCLFPNNSHCCVYSDASKGSLNCAEICAKAHRADGKHNSDGTAGTACAAGGNARCIGAITAQGRTPCYKQ